MAEQSILPGPADVGYFDQAQAGAWGEMLRSFARFVAAPAGARVLDVGTGPGLLPRLALEGGASLAVGVDDAAAMVQRAAELAGHACGTAAWVLADGLRLPFVSAAFDVTLATNWLFLLPDPAAGLAELARVARPGGVVAILNPSEAMSFAAAEAFAAGRGLAGFARFSFANYGRLAEAHQRLSAAQWAALADAAGLKDVRTEARAGGLAVFLRGVKPISG